MGLGTVRGEVLSNDGSRMLSAVDVVLFPAGSFSDRLVSRTDAQGVYSLPGVPLGPYSVRATDAESGLTGEASDEMRGDGDLHTTDIYLEASGRIAGTVYAPGVRLDVDGNPVDDAGNPLADPPVVSGADVTVRRGGFRQSVQTEADGSFQTSAFLPLGTYSLTARRLCCPSCSGAPAQWWVWCSTPSARRPSPRPRSP